MSIIDYNKEQNETIRKETVTYCLTLKNVYEDYPFHDPNWCVIRHRENKKIFAFIFEKDGRIWINVKCNPEWRDFWREAFGAVLPAFHMNKTHWNSIVLDGTIPQKEIQNMIGESYDLTAARTRESSLTGNGTGARMAAKNDRKGSGRHGLSDRFHEQKRD